MKLCVCRISRRHWNLFSRESDWSVHKSKQQGAIIGGLHLSTSISSAEFHIIVWTIRDSCEMRSGDLFSQKMIIFVYSLEVVPCCSSSGIDLEIQCDILWTLCFFLFRIIGLQKFSSKEFEFKSIWVPELRLLCLWILCDRVKLVYHELECGIIQNVYPVRHLSSSFSGIYFVFRVLVCPGLSDYQRNLRWAIPLFLILFWRMNCIGEIESFNECHDVYF